MRYANPVKSGLVGNLDRTAMFKFCRPTAFSAHQTDKYMAILPLIQQISKAFQDYAPERWAAQKAKCDATLPNWIIKNTVFSTVTINNNFQTAVHTDKGDLPEGFGNLTIIQKGQYNGGYMVLPNYRVAFDVRNSDVLLMDVHEWHGQTKMVPITKDPVQIVLVCYYRKNMCKCKDYKAELEAVKNRKEGDSIYHDQFN